MRGSGFRRRFIKMRLRREITTANAIALQLGVSIRTVYRDIDVLRAEGVRIIGAAGAGYMLRRSAR